MKEEPNLSRWRPWLVGCATAYLLSSSSLAQSPIGSNFLVNPESVGAQDEPDLQYDDHGGIWTVWLDSIGQDAEFDRVMARRISPQGELGPSLELLETSDISLTPALQPLVAPLPNGGIQLIYTRQTEEGFAQIYGQQFDASGLALGERFTLTPPPPLSAFASGIRSLPQGGFAMMAWGDPCLTCSRPKANIYARILAPNGSPASRYLLVDRKPGPAVPGTYSLAVDGSGNATFVWWVANGDFFESRDYSDIWVRRFSATGEPLGGVFPGNTKLQGTQSWPSVAAAPNGEFVVLWQTKFPGSLLRSIFGQRFSKTGQKVGPEFRINEQRLEKDFNPMVAMDRFGNFVVTWYSFSLIRQDCQQVRVRLFRHDGTPVGPELPAAPEFRACGEFPKIAFGPNGTFTVLWTVDLGFDLETGTDIDVHAARFSASPGDEPCIVRGGRLSCDTGRTGGPAELEIDFGGGPGETTLAGDFDGDGRADVCSYLEGTFRCDLDHRGEPAEGAALAFGQAGDVPLLGDVDGNGKTDPCVRRGDQLLCDTAHDGGAAEVALRFGAAEDLPLLGDVNGDGRDDLCLWRPGELRCDTAHEGDAPEVTIAFGQAGDLPALGRSSFR